MGWCAVMMGLILLVIGFGIYFTREYFSLKSENYPKKIQDPVHQFSGMLDLDDESSSTLVLNCPKGSTINVLEAFYNVYDPAGQCTSHPSDSLQCAPDDPAPSSLCENVVGRTTDGTMNMQNVVCSPSGTAECSYRTATPFLGTECNGKETCVVPLTAKHGIHKFVGPDPCNFISLPEDIASYAMLPKTVESDAGTDPIEVQGYRVHGQYRCISD